MVEQVEEAQLTKEETEIYDRQIRLWGVEAQQRLRKAKVLLIGLNGLGNEVCKNILLAGIKHLTLLDHTILTEDDVKNQFLAEKKHIGKNKAKSCYTRARELNPMVDIVVDTSHVDGKKEDFFKKFDVICLTGCCVEAQVKLNDICRRFGLKFLTGNVFGFFGFMFSDLGTHKYLELKVKESTKEESADGPSDSKRRKTDDVEEYEEKVEKFCSFTDALLFPLFEGKTLKQASEVTKSYLVMKVLHEYHNRYGEYPKQPMRKQDFEDVVATRNDIFEKLNIDNDFLDEDILSYCFGTFYPVNAIVGGVMSQEIIKALSGKDKPHNNFFFYDGVSTSGVVEKISPLLDEPEEKKSKEKHEEIIL